MRPIEPSGPNTYKMIELWPPAGYTCRGYGVARQQSDNGDIGILKTDLSDILDRTIPPEPWAEGEKIPWNDPGFSERMLEEHLNQGHDEASRGFETVDRHVAWIHRQLLAEKPTKILDLGCGPGYARREAERTGVACEYLEQDMRVAEYGAGIGLVMMIYGEINVFRPPEAREILSKAYHALDPGGRLLLEAHTLEQVRAIGEDGTSWYSANRGLFSGQPHICLQEQFWDDRKRLATERYYIIDAATGGMTRYATVIQAYTGQEYRTLLEDCGFGDIEFFPSLTGSMTATARDYLVITAQKR